MRTMWAEGWLGKRSPAAPEVVFGQVREDPSPELLVLRHAPQPARVFCIASGGCTAFALLGAGSESLLACDINPAQIALVDLKKAILARLDPASIRQAFLVSAQSAYGQVRDFLPAFAHAFWAERTRLLLRGLNQCGSVDRRLMHAMFAFRCLIHREPTVRRMLGFTDLERQVEYFQLHWKSWRWQASLRFMMEPAVLRAVYGRRVLDKLPRDFGLQLGEQIESAFLGSPSNGNACLWQTFMPHVPPGGEKLPYHLQAESLAACRQAIGRLSCVAGDAAKVIAAADAQFELAALSNIFELMAPAEAKPLVDALQQRMPAGAIAILRFFFEPPRELLELFSGGFETDSELALACAKADHGLFCKRVYIFRRRAQ